MEVENDNEVREAPFNDVLERLEDVSIIKEDILSKPDSVHSIGGLEDQIEAISFLVQLQK